MKEVHEMTPRTKRFFTCPCGGEEFVIEHLYETETKEAGPWFCHKCGKSWGIKLVGGNVKITEKDMVVSDTLVVLKLDPKNMKKPLYLITEGMVFNEKIEKTCELEQHKFYYEEHTCPTNWLKNIREICMDGEHDPHGLFEYVETRPFYKEPNLGPERFMDEDYVPNEE